MDEWAMDKNKITTLTTNGPATNEVLPKAGQTHFYETFVHNQTLVFQINSRAEKPRFRLIGLITLNLISKSLGYKSKGCRPFLT
jgi:hypothetical protein